MACPVILIDLAARPLAGIEDLELITKAAPDALVLVLDPGSHDGIAGLARELGATHVIAGPTTPPEVASLLARWLPIADRRSENDGWSRAANGREPEPWNWLNSLLAPPPDLNRPSRSGGV